MKFIVFIVLLPSLWAFVYVLYGENKIRRRTSHSMLDNREIDVKLPLLQFYFDNTLVSEIVYGTDPVSAETKLCSALKSITRGVEELVEHSSIVNIYSDDHLQDTLQGDYNYLLKLYENNCAKCRQFEESFLALHGTYGNKVVFLQARASDVPAHTQRTYLSLTGRVKSNKIDMEYCHACSGSGSVPCSGCNGSGVVYRGSLAVFCSQCAGKKVIRCSTCGGKCLNC